MQLYLQENEIETLPREITQCSLPTALSLEPMCRYKAPTPSIQAIPFANTFSALYGRATLEAGRAGNRECSSKQCAGQSNERREMARRAIGAGQRLAWYSSGCRPGAQTPGAWGQLSASYCGGGAARAPCATSSAHAAAPAPSLRTLPPHASFRRRTALAAARAR